MPQLFCFSFLFGAMFLLIFPCALNFLLMNMMYIFEWKVVTLGVTPIFFSIILDPISLLFSSVVFFISGNVMIFAIGYMAGEVYMHRFVSLIFLFVFSMNMLIFAPNLMVVLLGWDGLGVTSFLLVIYYQSPYALGAGLITALTNRVGDVGLILAIGVMLSSGHWVIPLVEPSGIICFFVILAAVTKSAQFPFSTWLPMAMAAPTPVSALVHSSTLVTAGIYLLIRFYSMLSQIEGVRSIFLIFSSFTMILAGLAAFMEVDFKKIIAFSTLSQLGVMMGALGLGSPMLAFFHLLAHAIFKALLFVCAGTYIHYHGHMQDFRTMGNLSNHLPITQVSMTIGNLALAGLPFLAGFYSKDPICEFGLVSTTNVLILVMLLVGVVLTSAYSMRAALFTQLGSSMQSSLSNLHNESSFFMVPTFLLAFMAVIWGCILNWILLPPVFIQPLSPFFAIAPMLALIMGGVGAVKLSFLGKDCLPYSSFPKASVLMHEGVVTIWFLSILSTQPMIAQPLKLGARLLSVVDQGWIEMGVGRGVVLLVSKLVNLVQPLHNNLPTTLLFLSMFILFPIVVLLV